MASCGGGAYPVYGVCRPDLTGSRLDRTITCDGSPDAPPLPSRVIVRTEAEGSCVTVIEEPDGGTTSRAVDFLGSRGTAL